MSFVLTTDQIRNRTKTVTRRTGWSFLKPGDHIRAVVKGMGLKKGEKVEPLAVLRVESVERERLDEITDDEVRLEGFPDMTPPEFMAMFCASHRVNVYGPCFPYHWTRPCLRADTITRIAFSYVEEGTR